jgi:NTE family protein
MNHLEEHRLFAGISSAAMRRLGACAQVRRYAAGDIILRAGDTSAELFGLLSGAARVELGDARVVLAPPQSFGEMSAISGSTVSATIVAQRDTETWVLSASDLFSALAEEPAFFRNISVLLGERLRHRTRAVSGAWRSPVVTLVVADDTVDDPGHVLLGLYAGVQHYEPASEQLDARGVEAVALGQRIGRWRAEGPAAQVLLLLIRPEQAVHVGALLEPSDFVLSVIGPNGGGRTPAGVDAKDWASDVANLRLGARAPATSGERWSHALDAAALAAAVHHKGSWARERCPDLDRLVRQIVGREIGIALSVGAAAGLAHLGLLEVLEDAGIPLDFLCGSSMGGAVAMACAHFGGARAAGDAICRLAGDFAQRRGMQWLPRAGLIAPARIDAISKELFGDAEFSQLRLPVAVVAADLVAARRVVLDTGPMALAARATTAIPGLLPPVRQGDAILVDGGLVTRVPADLLAGRRCGLSIAALVAPERAPSATRARAVADTLEARLGRPFGLGTVLAASWGLLGWWDSASQAQRADLVIRIATPSSEGFNFAAGRAFIAHGRQAAQAHLPAIRAAVDRTLSPGAP